MLAEHFRLLHHRADALFVFTDNRHIIGIGQDFTSLASNLYPRTLWLFIILRQNGSKYTEKNRCQGATLPDPRSDRNPFTEAFVDDNTCGALRVAHFNHLLYNWANVYMFEDFKQNIVRGATKGFFSC